ncbi:uncharacterized protein BX664DRAFT_118951 [Halteromyces radiatus]|uniref:uncharacterized protein n=1 Tax=Halteromyces radiatus TaxID=101107 RepID=UPI00221F67B8|nr:uncharacterized protein BX664DRAFT_118951 [Halteromyces radiatus]KAI8088693.1 hypothetical protein BX664DRAFT_118951 [Halteromyces radiatus]
MLHLLLNTILLLKSQTEVFYHLSGLTININAELTTPPIVTYQQYNRYKDTFLHDLTIPNSSLSNRIIKELSSGTKRRSSTNISDLSPAKRRKDATNTNFLPSSEQITKKTKRKRNRHGKSKGNDPERKSLSKLSFTNVKKTTPNYITITPYTSSTMDIPSTTYLDRHRMLYAEPTISKDQVQRFTYRTADVFGPHPIDSQIYKQASTLYILKNMFPKEFKRKYENHPYLPKRVQNAVYIVDHLTRKHPAKSLTRILNRWCPRKVIAGNTEKIENQSIH